MTFDLWLRDPYQDGGGVEGVHPRPAVLGHLEAVPALAAVGGVAGLADAAAPPLLPSGLVLFVAVRLLLLLLVAAEDPVLLVVGGELVLEELVEDGSHQRGGRGLESNESG